MSKPLSLLLASASTGCLVAAGISLSRFQAGWALLFLGLSFAITGAGMAYKRRARRK